MILVRKLHRMVGLVLSPLFLLQAIAGILLRLKVHSAFLYNVHTWFKYDPGLSSLASGLATVVAVGIGLGLLFQAVTGLALYVNLLVMRARRRARKPATAPAAGGQ